jgi:hypothetical protein
MLTRSKLIIASILLLGSTAVARAEDPETTTLTVQRPAISSQLRSSSFVEKQQFIWEKRTNGDAN